MLLFEVSSRFDKVLERRYADRPEVLSFLKNHPRKSLAVKNLCREVISAETKMVRRFTPKHLDWLVEFVVSIYARAAIAHRDESFLSEAEKSRVSKKTDYEGLEKDLIDRGILIDGKAKKTP